MWMACEAKFGAPLGGAQLAAYADAAPLALLVVVVVRESRLSEAQEVLGGVPAGRGGRNGVVLSWAQVCDAIADAGAEAGDAEQLRALCRAAAGLDVAPLRDKDLGASRHDRLDDLHRLTEQVPQRLHEHSSTRDRCPPT
jgi:hypothetical protein